MATAPGPPSRFARFWVFRFSCQPGRKALTMQAAGQVAGETRSLGDV